MDDPLLEKCADLKPGENRVVTVSLGCHRYEARCSGSLSACADSM